MKVIEEKGLIRKLKGSCGYGNPETKEVFVDGSLETREKSVVVIHEVLEIWLKKRVKHSNIDKIVIDIVEALQQVGELE